MYLGRLHHGLEYTSMRDWKLSVRGVRFLLLILIACIAYEMVKRHIEFINLGWW